MKIDKEIVLDKFDKKMFEILSNKFLIQIEESDKDKLAWEIKNHIPILYESLKEFYIWLEKNYWN